MGQKRTTGHKDVHGQPAVPLDEHAYRLHCAGKSYREIARLLGIDKNTVTKYVNSLRAETADALKAEREALIAERVDGLQRIKERALDAYQSEGSVAYLNTARACEMDIAGLLGLRQPEVSGQGGTTVNVIYVNDWRKDA